MEDFGFCLSEILLKQLGFYSVSFYQPKTAFQMLNLNNKGILYWIPLKGILFSIHNTWISEYFKT